MATERLSEKLLAQVRQCVLTTRNQAQFEEALSRVARAIDTYVPSAFDVNEVQPDPAASPALPFGHTEWMEWPGGTGIVEIEGIFGSEGGVSTSVELLHQAKQEDGSLARILPVRTFSAPGQHAIGLSPGRYRFVASGPSAQLVRVRLFDPPLKPKAPTLEDRIEALEARLGKSGLDG